MNGTEAKQGGKGHASASKVWPKAGGFIVISACAGVAIRIMAVKNTITAAAVRFTLLFLFFGFGAVPLQL